MDIIQRSSCKTRRVFRIYLCLPRSLRKITLIMPNKARHLKSRWWNVFALSFYQRLCIILGASVFILKYLLFFFLPLKMSWSGHQIKGLQVEWHGHEKILYKQRLLFIFNFFSPLNWKQRTGATRSTSRFRNQSCPFPWLVANQTYGIHSTLLFNP